MRLGVLQGRSDVVAHRIGPALEILSAAGLRCPSDDLRSAVGVGLVHRSLLYEEQETFPRLTTAHLGALELLGHRYRRRAAAFRTYQGHPTLSKVEITRVVNHVDTVTPDWAAEQDWLRSSVMLGASFRTSPPPKKMLAVMLHQLLGVLCVAGEGAVAERLLADLVERNAADRDTHEAKTKLQERLKSTPLSYEYTASGPNNARVYTATVSDGGTREGRGEGLNKRAAAQAAALDFIREHDIDISTVDARRPRRPPQPLTANRTGVDRLLGLFDLPESAAGLLSQALVHKSWAHEHAGEMREAEQQDNAVLSFVGNQLVEFEYTLSVTSATLQVADLAEQGIPTQTSSVAAEAFARTGCELLIGKGQVALGVTRTMASDTFEALCAATCLGSGNPLSLGDSWPLEWSEIWQLISPERARGIGAYESLLQLTDTAELTMTYRVASTGPEHLPDLRASIDIDSAATGRITSIVGPWSTSRRQARDRAIAPLATLLDDLSVNVPSLPASTPLARFVMAHLFAAFAGNPSLYRKWAGKRLLGLHLLHSPVAMLEWASGVDDWLDEDFPSELMDALSAAFATAAPPGTSLPESWGTPTGQLGRAVHRALGFPR